MSDPQQQFKFPENAYRELKPGEKFVPMVPPNVRVPELTLRMFIFGLAMNVVFSVAATFLALKAGQGIETAIPISILAVGLSGFLAKALGRGNSILENMYALSISTTSGYVAGGTCFTMPAIYILQLNKNLDMSDTVLFLEIALVPFLGAILGALFLIPFRRYFVKEMHGKLPFPEATATNEILVTGASGSTAQAGILIYSFLLSAVYTFVATGLKLFSDKFTTGVATLETAAGKSYDALAFGSAGLFATLTTKIKAVFSMGTGAYYLGLGFIIGPRYASIICAGSLLSCFAIIPLMSNLNLEQLQVLNSSCTAHSGELESTPRFTMPAEVGGILGLYDPNAVTDPLPEAVAAARTMVRTAFAGHDIKLADDATFGSRQLSQQWEINSNKLTYLLVTDEAGLKVRRSDDPNAAFTLPASDGTTLDSTLLPNDRVRAEVGRTFAASGYPFRKADVGVKIDEAGHKWVLKDRDRTYELRMDPGGTAIAVYSHGASAGEIFGNIPKNIGIGAIFTAGLISILRMMGVIVTALRQALGSLFRKREGAAVADHTDEDMGYGTIVVLGLLAVVAMALFFRFVVYNNPAVSNPLWLTFISVVLALVVAFLFTTVSAWAIAMISVTPISGMTVTTIIITAVLLSLAGLPKGDHGMLAVLLVGGVVCTALSMAGGLVTNFKMGYWLGASPKRITWNALVGSLISAIFVCGTIMVLAYKPGYTGPGHLDAPQANMMASALESFLGTGEVPWLLYGIGVMIALTMQLLNISPLAFGLGMYLPMYINTPILIGAWVSSLVKAGTKDEKLAKARSNKGVLIASGLIAGGAIMEVLVNFTGAIDDLAWNKTVMPALDLGAKMVTSPQVGEHLAQTQNWLGAVLFLALCVFVYFDCRRAKPELGEGGEIHM